MKFKAYFVIETKCVFSDSVFSEASEFLAPDTVTHQGVVSS